MSYSSLLGVTWALAEPPLGVCSACPGTPAVLPLRVMQLATLSEVPLLADLILW